MAFFRKMRLSNGQAVVLLEILIRASLTVLFLYLEDVEPFERHIQSDELWLYKNPTTSSYVPAPVLWLLVFLLPCLLFLLHFCFTRDRTELYQATMALSLAVGLNGVITDLVKIIVGRPRPDFLSRCFPDGAVHWPGSDPDASLGVGIPDISTACTGDVAIIREGRKSFPSGHSSFAFSALGFVSLWLCGKLRLLSSGRGEGWRLVLTLLPLTGAVSIALSRTCDYHHHWQDVLVGSLLGMCLAYVCYRQYFPILYSPDSHRCLNSRNSTSLHQPFHDAASVPLHHQYTNGGVTAAAAGSSRVSSHDASSMSSSSSRIPSPSLHKSYSLLPP